MVSSWEETKKRSQYHFDTSIMDPKWDAAILLGNIQPTWKEDLASIIEKSKPSTWATRGYKGEGILQPQKDLVAEEYDLESAGYGKEYVISHLNWDIPVSLKEVSNNFGLANCMERIHVQFPGEVWNLHIDKLQKWNPENPNSVMRIFIQLTDWQPGQFWEFGNYHYNRWHAGDVATMDWQNVPHSTANAGYHPRVTFQLTGIITDKTKAFLETIKKPIA